MITPQFTVTVNDTQLRLHLEKLPTTLRTNLRATITKLTNDLLAQVRALEPVRTGRLRSQTRAFVDEGENYIRGRVRVLGSAGAPNIAAAALEYGAHRRFVVGAYTRRGIAVRAYERRANIAARSFLRGPAASLRERALAELEAAVAKSVEETNAA